MFEDWECNVFDLIFEVIGFDVLSEFWLFGFIFLVVIFVFNEEWIFVMVLDRVLEFKVFKEVVVVDDYSLDGMLVIFWIYEECDDVIVICFFVN